MSQLHLDYRDVVEHAAIQGIQRRIREKFHSASLTVPVELERVWPVARRIIICPDLPHSVKAASVATPDGNYIVLNTQYGNLSQRFSIAHELIHLVYNEPPVEQQSEFYHDMVELKANAGAAELLLPYEWFTAEAARRLGEPLGSLEDLKVYLATPDARAWAGLARVSRAVLGRHLLDHNWVRRPERSVHVG